MAKEEFILDAKGLNLVTIERNFEHDGRKIINRNFSGVQTKFNPAGSRYFTVDINDPELVNILVNRGFNVKEYNNPNKPDSTPIYSLKVKLKFNENGYGPLIEQYTNGQPEPVVIDESIIDSLDDAYITDCLISIRPYDWDSASGHGTTAWLNAMKITIASNTFLEGYGERFGR